jgi:hypothetical protein
MKSQKFSVRLLLSALALAVFALLVTPPAAEAQYVGNGFDTIVNGGTNNIAAGATNVYTNSIISPVKSEYLAVGVGYNFTVAPIGVTPTATLRLQRSLDGSNWESTPFHVLSPNGATNSVVWVTNFVIGASQYFRVSGVENTNSSAITNFTIWYALKR